MPILRGSSTDAGRMLKVDEKLDEVTERERVPRYLRHHTLEVRCRVKWCSDGRRSQVGDEEG